MFILGISIETLIIVLLSVVTGVVYHMATYADMGSLMQFVGFGLLVAALFEMPLVMHSHYMMEHDHVGRRSIARMANAWAYAFMWIALIALLTKTGDQISRGWLADDVLRSRSLRYAVPGGHGAASDEACGEPWDRGCGAASRCDRYC